MSVDMKVKAIYDSEISNITRSEKNWKDVLKVAGQLYRYEFDNIVMVTAQRSPEKSTLMADYDTWKKVGRYVKRGAKGCAIFPSRALNPRMRYIFDISDTGGKNVKLTWDLEGENLKSYADFLVSEGQMERYKSDDRESLKNTLKQFTGTNVWDIIKEEFGDRMSELMQLSGSVIKEFNEKRKGLQQDSDMEQLVYSSVMYAVGTRCGFDLSVQEQDFSQIVNIKDEEIVYRLGSLVCDVSCSVLREFSRNLQTIESERRISYVRSNDLQGSGRTAVSGADNAGRDRGFNEAGQIRENGNEVSSGERTGKVQDTDEIALTAYNVIDVELNQKIQMMNGEKTSLAFVKGDPMGKLVKLLRMLTGDKYGYDYSDIVILTLKTESESIMNNISKISGIPITREKSKSSILFTTAKKFKGLESRVIIIVDIDESSFNDEKEKRNFYVACSRATQYLSLIVEGDDQKIKSIADVIAGPNFAPKGKIAMKTQATPLRLD